MTARSDFVAQSAFPWTPNESRKGVEIIRRLGTATILQAVLAPAELRALRRVDAPQANARTVNFERVAFDDAGLPGHVAWQGPAGRREKQHGSDCVA